MSFVPPVWASLALLACAFQVGFSQVRVDVVNLEKSDASPLLSTITAEATHLDDLRVSAHHELTGQLPEVKNPSLTLVQQLLHTAVETRRKKLQFQQAITLLQEAQTTILKFPPTRKSNELLGQILWENAINLALLNSTTAPDLFRLASIYLPEETLDKSSIHPQVYRDFVLSQKKQPALPIEIRHPEENAQIFVDGKDIGRSPVQVSLTQGRHVIQSRSAQFQPTQTIITVTKATPIALSAKPLSHSQRITSLRRSLTDNLTPHGLDTLGRRLDSHYLLLLKAREQGAVFASYNVQTRVLSPWRKTTMGPRMILARFRPIRPPAPAPRPPWYRRHRVQGLLAFGVIAGVAGGLFTYGTLQQRKTVSITCCAR